MSPTQVSDTTSDPGAPDTNSWQRTASRAAHPSAVAPLLGPGDLLREIAAGMGGVTVPVGLDGTTPRRLTRDLVLTTPAYDVWVMHWPSGEAADLHAHERFVAFHVVSGSIVEERYTGADLERTSVATGDTVVVPPGTPHRLISSAPTTTVHVHAKDLG